MLEVLRSPETEERIRQIVSALINLTGDSSFIAHRIVRDLFSQSQSDHKKERYPRGRQGATICACGVMTGGHRDPNPKCPVHRFLKSQSVTHAESEEK